jgi:two-component system response regulator FixJ
VSDSPTVYLIDDDKDVRASIALMLDVAGIPVQAFASGAEFLAIAPGLNSGCVLTDVRMPGIDGIELQRRLREMGVDLPLLMMTGQADVPTAIKAMKAGASDFIEKPFKVQALLDAVKAAIEVGRRASLHRAEIASIKARLETLTPRESEVLVGLVAGHQNKVIAHDLGMSPRTVEVHRARIMDKTGAKSLSELVQMAMAAAGANDGSP